MSKFEDIPADEAEWPKGASNERPKVVPLHKGNGEAKTDEIPLPDGESAFSLVERDLPDPVRFCDPWATEGVCVLASRPKLGKTTLLRQKMAAACIGGDFLGAKFMEPMKCAFLSLEEGELLCRTKFKMAGFSDDSLASIQLFFSWPRGDAGVNLLDRWLDAHQDVHFVVIDSLTKFRMLPDVRMPAFMADYEAMGLIHEMSKKHPGTLIDVAHHTRKNKSSDDPIDDISGTYGLTAACDAYCVMRHHADGATMHWGGRLWTKDDTSFRLKRSPGHRWEMLGVNLGLSDEQLETLAMVRASPTGLSGAELAEKLNITNQSAWGRLDLLLEKGFVSKRYGRVYSKD